MRNWFLSCNIQQLLIYVHDFSKHTLLFNAIDFWLQVAAELRREKRREVPSEKPNSIQVEPLKNNSKTDRRFLEFSALFFQLDCSCWLETKMAVPFWLPGQRKYAHSAQLKFLLKTTKMHTTGGVKLIYDDFETIGFSFLPMSVYFKDVHTLCYWNVNRKSCESHFTTFSFFLLFDSRKSDVVKRVKNLELDTIKTTISRLYKIPVKTSWKTTRNFRCFK